jgi:hypothetical protein
MGLLSIDSLVPGPRPVPGREAAQCGCCGRPAAVSELGALPTGPCRDELAGESWCGRCRRGHASFCRDCATAEFDYGDDQDPGF